MDTLTVLLLIFCLLLLTGIGVVIWLMQRNFNQLKSQVDPNVGIQSWLTSVQSQMQVGNHQVSHTVQTLQQQLTQVLTQTSHGMNQRLEKNSDTLLQVTTELTKMVELGKTMKELQMLLQAPKLRGVMGEVVLKDMLKQILPSSNLKFQYSFGQGNIVDAVIKTSAGLLSVDSKFPLENFQKSLQTTDLKERVSLQKLFTQDVKKHIKSISEKYIRPHEGTVDFALMYIPSESIFYEIACSSSVLDYARSMRVYPVSPNTLYVHLQTLLLSFEGQRLETRSKQVLSLLKTLQKDYEKMDDTMKVLGKHLHNANSQFLAASQQTTLFGQKLNYQELLEDKSS